MIVVIYMYVFNFVQVILLSETIQELTKTSQALSSMQVEASELRKSTELLKSENVLCTKLISLFITAVTGAVVFMVF